MPARGKRHERAAHAMESLYTPLANPVAELAALRGAELIALALAADPIARDEVALGALLAGYASAGTGIAIHHATCQTIVRLRARRMPRRMR